MNMVNMIKLEFLCAKTANNAIMCVEALKNWYVVYTMEFEFKNGENQTIASVVIWYRNKNQFDIL